MASLRDQERWGLWGVTCSTKHLRAGGQNSWTAEESLKLFRPKMTPWQPYKSTWHQIMIPVLGMGGCSSSSDRNQVKEVNNISQSLCFVWGSNRLNCCILVGAKAVLVGIQICAITKWKAVLSNYVISGCKEKVKRGRRILSQTLFTGQGPHIL